MTVGDVALPYRRRSSTAATAKKAGLRRRAFAGAGAQFLAVHGDVPCVGCGTSVFGLSSFQADDHTHFQGIPRPTLSGQPVGASHFASPVGDLAGLWILH